jgi:hypothetical protein
MNRSRDTSKCGFLEKRALPKPVLQLYTLAEFGIQENLGYPGQ